MTRILLLNPNVTEAVTARMAQEARAAASPGVEILTATAPFGVSFIENRVESALAAHAVLEALAERLGSFDAAIVGAFGEPGLLAARELCDVPVVGPFEATMLLGWPLAKRISIVSFSARFERLFEETAAERGLGARLASVRTLGAKVADVGAAAEDLAEPLLALAERCIAEDGAEALVFAGGPLAGLARRLGGRLPVPALDPTACAVRMAEMLVGLAPRKAARGSFARPGAKPSLGLSPALARVFEP